jgi:hypothetical protein
LTNLQSDKATQNQQHRKILDGWLPVAALVEQLERNMMQGTLSSSSNWNQKFKFAVKN